MVCDSRDPGPWDSEVAAQQSPQGEAGSSGGGGSGESEVKIYRSEDERGGSTWREKDHFLLKLQLKLQLMPKWQQVEYPLGHLR